MIDGVVVHIEVNATHMFALTSRGHIWRKSLVADADPTKGWIRFG